jgi:hypothetical protein
MTATSRNTVTRYYFPNFERRGGARPFAASFQAGALRHPP